jgi:hypothetical protein
MNKSRHIKIITLSLIIILFCLSGCKNTQSTNNIANFPILDNTPQIDTLVVDDAYPVLNVPDGRPIDTKTITPTINGTELLYLWPRILPEGYIILRESIRWNNEQFSIDILVPLQHKGGFINTINILGGKAGSAQIEKSTDEFLHTYDEITDINGENGYLKHGNGGWAIYWRENENKYLISEIGYDDKQMIIDIAVNASRLDLESWLGLVRQE